MLIDNLLSLIPAEKHSLWRDYTNFIELGRARFAYEEDKTDFKEEKIRLLEKAVRRDLGGSKNILSRLQKDFIKENLSISLLTDWLVVWRYTATMPLPLSERRLSDIIGYAASPLARMIMALNNENPSVYLPFSSLISAVLFLQAEEEGYKLFKGCKWSAKQKRGKLKGWLKNSRVLLNVVKSKRLKFKMALLLNRLDFYERTRSNNQQRHTTFLDEMRIFLYSIWQFVTIPHKSVKIKGL